jgi:hypothetical protein
MCQRSCARQHVPSIFSATDMVSFGSVEVGGGRERWCVVYGCKSKGTRENLNFRKFRKVQL